MNIAVTGGLGSGKSTASKILAAAISADHLDTDDLCRQQMQPGSAGFEMFSQMFGVRFLHGDGSLNRQLLRQTVFADSEVRKGLESILHPLVRRQVTEHYVTCCAAGKNLVVEVPLLFEVGWQHDFNVWVVVYVREDLCFKRVAIRDGAGAEEIRRVWAAQISPQEKLKLAHFVIDNSGTFVSTVQQIAWLGKNIHCRENSRNQLGVRLKSLTAKS